MHMLRVHMRPHVLLHAHGSFIEYVYIYIYTYNWQQVFGLCVRACVEVAIGSTLAFEQNCISFHETDRSVRTASSEQVRQPINKKGQGRWKPYAEHLKPLINSLDKNLLHQEDIDLINK